MLWGVEPPRSTPPSSGMMAKENMVFLFDVDNTLLDNDVVQNDLKSHLEHEFGADVQERYWAIFEELHAECGYSDHLGTLQRYRLEERFDPRLLTMSSYLMDYPFADRLYPDAFKVLTRAGLWGPTVILTDGDAVFQPRKVQRSGLWDAVEGRVLIYIHKEQMLDEIEKRYPASHYVMVDDKLRILTAMKEFWGERLTTVWPRQGHYALDRKVVTTFPRADISIEHIGDLVHFEREALLHRTAPKEQV